MTAHSSLRKESGTTPGAYSQDKKNKYATLLGGDGARTAEELLVALPGFEYARPRGLSPINLFLPRTSRRSTSLLCFYSCALLCLFRQRSELDGLNTL